MSNKTSDKTTDTKSVASKGRLYSFLIAIFLIIFEFIYYWIYSSRAADFGGGKLFFIPRFLLEPFTFMSTFLGTVNFYSISLPVLGLLIVSLITFFISISVISKKSIIKTVSSIIGIILVILYATLMIADILPFDIGIILVLLAIVLLSFNFPFKRIIAVAFIVIGFGITTIMAIVNPYLGSADPYTEVLNPNFNGIKIKTFYRSFVDEKGYAVELKSNPNYMREYDRNNNVISISDPKGTFSLTDSSVKTIIDSNGNEIFIKEPIAFSVSELPDEIDFNTLEAPEVYFNLTFSMPVVGTLHITKAEQIISSIDEKGNKTETTKNLTNFNPISVDFTTYSTSHSIPVKGLVPLLKYSYYVEYYTEPYGDINNIAQILKKSNGFKELDINEKDFKALSFDPEDYTISQAIDYIENVNIKNINKLPETIVYYLADREREAQLLEQIADSLKKVGCNVTIEGLTTHFASINEFSKVDTANLIETFGGKIETRTGVAYSIEDQNFILDLRSFIDQYGNKIKIKDPSVDFILQYDENNIPLKNEKPAATFILKFDKAVSGTLHIVDAEQTIVGINEEGQRTETKKKPDNFKPISIDFSEYSRVQIVPLKELEPFTEYWYYIESYSQPYGDLNKIKGIVEKIGGYETEKISEEESKIYDRRKEEDSIKRMVEYIENYYRGENLITAVREYLSTNKEDKKQQIISLIVETIKKFGGNISENDAKTHIETFKLNNVKENDITKMIEKFGGKIEKRNGLYYKTQTQTFFTETRPTKDDQSPLIVDADIYVQPMDIDFSDFVRDNYEKIKTDIKDASKKGYYAELLGTLWGIPKGESRTEKERSSKFYELLEANADNLLSIIPTKESITKETADNFMAKIREIILSQQANPNLAENLKVPAYIKMVVTFDEPSSGILGITIKKNKDPLEAKPYETKSYKWETEFTLKDFQKTETNKFDVNAYKNSELIVFLERKYSYSVKPEDEFGNVGNLSQHDDSGIQSNISQPNYSDIFNIIITIILIIILIVASIISIQNMKKKFMLKESLPNYISLFGGVLILIINILVSIIGVYPIRLDFFIILSLTFFIMSGQEGSLKLSMAVSGSLILISVLTILSMAIPGVKHSYIPPIDPNVPSTFRTISHITLVTAVFSYILSFACISNMLLNNMGNKKNYILNWVLTIISLAVAVIMGILAISNYNANLDGSSFRDVAFIFGTAFVGFVIGNLVKGDWGKSLGKPLFFLLVVALITFIVMGFVPFKLPALILLAGFLLIGTTWARTASYAYFFIQAFILIWNSIIFIVNPNYPFYLKLMLTVMGIIYFIVGLFTFKSAKVKDYSEGKL